MNPPYKKPDRGFIMAPEDIEPLREYTFTLNPDDDHQYWAYPDRIDMVKEWGIHVIDKLSAQISLYIEISRLGRLHFHGTIKWNGSKQVLAFYCNELHDVLKHGQIEIGNIDSLSEWSEYCQKSKHIISLEIHTTDAHIKRLKNVEKLSSKNAIIHKHTF